MSNYPNVWGEGNLFAFSGFEGKTGWSYPFVGTLLEKRVGFIIRTEREKRYWVSLRNGNKIGEMIKRKEKNCYDYFSAEIVAGDIISLHCGFKNFNIQLIALPLSKNEIIIRITPETVTRDSIINLVVRIEACKELFFNGYDFVIKTDKDTTFLSLNQKAIIYSVVDSIEEVERVMRGEAEKRACSWDGDKEVRYLVISNLARKSKPLDILISSRRKKRKVIQLSNLKKKRETFYTERMTDYKKRTLAKAMSILKANVESPQGVFKQRWTTPDRWPHRHLWLWDSCFHALGCVFIDNKLAEDSILSVLNIQRENGFIPHIGRPDGNFSNITQPPLLSWAVYKIYQHTGNKKFLTNCYPKLRAYLLWCLRNRDKNRNRLLEWKRSDESGMDNSSRFNNGCIFDAIDFSSILVNDLLCLYKIGKEIASADENLRKKANKVSRKIEQYLWNRKKGFFFDRYFNGGFSFFKTACGFLPLFSGSANNHQVEFLVRHLKNPNEFNTPFPVPSEAIDSPTFDNNMWRGPVWLNYNYFIIEGLKKYGVSDLADKIRKKTLREVEKWYRKEGTIFEFYDPFSKVSPRRMPRKDKYGAIKEFGWSAAIYILLTLEQQ